MGHISRSADITLNVDNRVWFTNISHIASMLRVENVQNASTLWEDETDDDQKLEKGIRETLGILDTIRLNPEATTASLWTLMLLSGIISILMIMLFFFVCIPGSLMSCKRSCCCCNKIGRKEREVRSEDY